MREPKYRAWHKATGKMYPVKSFTWFDKEIDPGRGLDTIRIDQIENDYITTAMFLSPDDIELMEYTGLKDYLDNEICEGDILLYPHEITLRDQHVWPHKTIAVPPQDHKLIVIWDGAAFFLDDQVTGNRLLLHLANLKEMEIIGNIYETPDLICKMEQEPGGK